METKRLRDPGVVAWVENRAPFGMFSTDSKLRVTGWNAWLENHSGMKLQDVKGKDLLGLYPEIVDRKMGRYFNEALEGLNVILSQAFHGYLLPLPTDGSADSVAYMSQSAIISPLIIDDRISGTIGYVEDVTQRIKREKELIEQAAEREKLIEELKASAAEIKSLSRFLPICANCKKIRNKEGHWEQIEAYFSEHADVSFSHGICPDCAKKLYPEFYEDDGVTLKEG